MKRKTIILLVCVTALTAGLTGRADDKHGKGHKDDSRENGDNQDERGESRSRGQRTFSEDERHTVDFYVQHHGTQEGKHPRSLPPGLAKKAARGNKLPPGWETECVPGRVMPEPVYQECHPLPPDLTVQLPVPPVGTVTVAVGGKVVRLLEATREILDVFDVHVNL